MNFWKRLLEIDISNCIKTHENDDIITLALKKPPQADWPWPLILDQIKARQKAKTKMPSWHKADNITLPPSSLLEQASSEATARYKASLVTGKNFADLTAGAGVDFWAFQKNFQTGVAIERDEEASELLAHNLKILNVGDFEIIQGDAEKTIETLPPQDFIYIDPQRRNDKGKGRFMFEDCAPDIINLPPILKNKTKTIMIKTSPVLDIDYAITVLQCVKEVHVVEWRGECREVLYILDPHQETAPDSIPINAIAIDDSGMAIKKFQFTRAEEKNADAIFAMPEQYLFEPGPAFQKAGCFKTLATRYDLKKLHPHTHLYTSATPCPDFPGRAFMIKGVYPPRAKNLPFSKANLTLRNYPGSVADLRKKLKLADGGEDYLFACTLKDDSKTLIHTRKFDFLAI